MTITATKRFNRLENFDVIINKQTDLITVIWAKQCKLVWTPELKVCKKFIFQTYKGLFLGQKTVHKDWKQ